MIYYDSEDQEIVASADVHNVIADTIRKNSSESTVSESPDEVRFLSIRKGHGLVTIKCTRSSVVISGSPEKLLAVASNFAWLAAQEPVPGILSPHLHLEYAPNHPIFSADSEPLLITLANLD